MYLNVHRSTAYNGQDMEATQVPINRWLDKEGVIHIHNGIVLSLRKELNTAICSNMDGPEEYYT